MAISTYSELQTAVGNWLTRSDQTSKIPDYISLAESRLNRVLELRLSETLASLTLASGATSVALPTGFVAPIALWDVTDGNKRELRMIPTGRETSTAGDVYDWRIQGANIVFPNPASSAVSLQFLYTKSFALSDEEPTNWLLTNHPDAYLFASIAEAAMVLRDTELLALAESRLASALDQIQTKENRSKAHVTMDTSYGRMPSHDRDRYGWDGYGYV